MADCQEVFVVIKEFIMFLKYKLKGQGEIYPGGAYHLILVAQNGKRSGISFFMTAPRKNIEETFSGNISMFQKSFQSDTMIIA